MAYLYGTTTELVYRKDIIHMTFSRFDLFERGWTERQIKEYLGQPDYRVRRGHRNTGPILYWKKARVNEIEARLNHVTIPALGYNQDAGDDKEEISASFEEWNGALLEFIAADNMAAYLKHRAIHEGTYSELTPDFFLQNVNYLGKSLFGMTMFGITLDPETGNIKSDDQEPCPGFLHAWLSRKIN